MVGGRGDQETIAIAEFADQNDSRAPALSASAVAGYSARYKTMELSSRVWWQGGSLCRNHWWPALDDKRVTHSNLTGKSTVLSLGFARTSEQHPAHHPVAKQNRMHCGDQHVHGDQRGKHPEQRAMEGDEVSGVQARNGGRFGNRQAPEQACRRHQRHRAIGEPAGYHNSKNKRI